MTSSNLIASSLICVKILRVCLHFKKNLSKQSGHREIAVVSRVFAVLKSETYKLQINEILQIQGYTRKGAYNSNPTY